MAGLGASETTGSVIAVRVVLPPSLASAVPMVAIESDAEPGRRREATIDAAGIAWFAALPISRYQVIVRAAGTESARIGVSLGAHEVVRLRATMAPVGQTGSQVGVTDRYPIGEGTIFSRRMLDDLPAGGDVWALVETAAPFVVVDRIDNGGLGAGRSALMGSRGESWALTSLEFGGMEVRQGSRAGLWAIAPNAAFVESVAVMSGLAPIEAGTPGVRVSLTPRMPGPRWSGTLEGSITTPGMVATNRLPMAPSIARLESWRDGRVTAGGPVSARAGLLLSGAVTRTRLQERDQPERFSSSAATLFAHGVSRPGDHDQVRLMGGLQWVRHPFDGRRQFRQDVVDEQGMLGQLRLVWDRTGEGGARYAVSAGLQQSRFTPQDLDAGTLGGTVDRVTAGVVPPPAQSVRTALWDVAAEFDRPTVQWRSTRHVLRGGVSVRRLASTSRVLAAPSVAEAVAGLPARVWHPHVPTDPSRRTATEAAAYLGDRILLSPTVSVAAGLRLDVASGSARGAGEGIDWAALSPRVSFRWSPARLALFGGYARYAGTGTLVPLLAYGDPGVPWSEVHRWMDADGSGQFDPGETGVLVARSGRGAAVASIDPALGAPATAEWTIGAEYRQGPLMTLRGAIVIRRQSNLVGSINTGVPFSAYRTFTVPDIGGDEGSPHDDQLLPIYERLPSSFGDDAFLLTNPEGARATYDGIELSWELQSSRWFMLFGATAYRAEGLGGDLGAGVFENDQLVIGSRFEQPNAALNAPGRLFFDRAYVGKWSGAYRAPGDIGLAFTVRYQDGQPFTRLVIVPDLAGGPEMVHAYRMGRTRFTYTGTIDARVEKRFTIGGRRAGVRFDAFNLTNLGNEVEEDVVSGPAFRRSTAVQPPLTLRLGFHLAF